MRKLFLISLIAIILSGYTISLLSNVSESYSPNISELYQRNISAIALCEVAKENKFGISEKYYGTGFVIDKHKGLVITASHVITELDESVNVKLNNGLLINGTVKVIDIKNDIAIIKVDPIDLVEVSTLRLEMNTVIGEKLFCIGNPGRHIGTVSSGILSTSLIINDDILSPLPHKYYISDIHACGGSSGSPVFNLDGEVIGIVVRLWESYIMITPSIFIEKLINENEF